MTAGTRARAAEQRTATAPGRRRRPVVVRVFGERLSLRLRWRGIAACVLLIGLVAVSGVFSLALGSGQYAIGPADALRTVFGTGNADDFYIVNQVRLPRVTAAVLVGALLGLAGAVFQSLSDNPLGSPDIIGYNDGAAAGAVFALMVLPAGALSLSAGSIAGGLVTALVVYALTVYKGQVSGQRLVLVGIGVTALVKSVNAYLLTRAQLDEARSAQAWFFGSLNGLTWGSLGPAVAGIVLFVPPVALLSRRLALLEMGEDAARALGVGATRVRLWLVLAGVGLTGAAIATAGPIAFVALAAPQIGRRLTRTAGPGLLGAALTGSLLLVLADSAGQRAFAPLQIPVGLVTGVVGGLYLVILLVSRRRRSR